jgi:hypothetical protein
MGRGCGWPAAAMAVLLQKAAVLVWPERHIANCSSPNWQKVPGLRTLRQSNIWPVSIKGVMLGGLADSRRLLPLSLWKRRLLGTVVVGAFPLSGGLTLPEPASGQASETLPEVTVTAPRPAPKPPRRAAPARAAPAAARPAPKPPAAPAPAPAALPAFQVVAPTPLTGIGFDRSKVPAMVQTIPPRTSRGSIRPTWLRRSRSAFRASALTMSKATNSPRTCAIADFPPRRCRARRRGLLSTCKVSASTKPLAIPSTGT